MKDVLIVGAGPIGLACAIELKRRGITSILVEQGSVADAIRRFPSNMTFFSTADLIELNKIPLVSQGFRPTRFETLKYYSRVASAEELEIRRHAKVTRIGKQNTSFMVEIEGRDKIECRRIILAVGYFDQPNRLNVPGESLPHVSHYYDEGLRYTGMNVAVVGGQNSACDTALDLFRSGAKVSIVHRGESFGHSVKYWVRPDIENRVRNGEIKDYLLHEVTEILPGEVRVRNVRDTKSGSIAADFVFLMSGYHPDTALLESAGVRIEKETLIPAHDPKTFETNVSGLYVAGSVTAGKRTSDIFIENGRVHAEIISAHIATHL